MGSAGYNAHGFSSTPYNGETRVRVVRKAAFFWDCRQALDLAWQCTWLDQHPVAGALLMLKMAWDVKQETKTERQLAWDSRQIGLSIKKYFCFDVLQAMANDRHLRWDVHQGVFANIKRGDEHFKRSGYNTSHASLYGDALYNGRHQVRGNGGTIFCWHVWKNVSTQRQITWDALRSAKAKQFLRWDVHGIGVDCQRQIAWDLRQGVYAKRKIAWRIHLKDFHVIWRIHPTYHQTTRINHRDHKEASCPFLNKT